MFALDLEGKEEKKKKEKKKISRVQLKLDGHTNALVKEAAPASLSFNFIQITRRT